MFKENGGDGQKRPPRRLGRRSWVATSLELSVILLVTFSTVTLGSALADPNIVCVPCSTSNCCSPGGGGSCPGSSPGLQLSSSSTANVTNATISYWLTTSSDPTIAESNVVWGPTSSYGFTTSNQSVGTLPSTDKVFLDFLSPNGTTYYYKVTATASCTDSNGEHNYRATSTGSFLTGTNHVTQFAGFILNQYSSQHAPARILVSASCVAAAPSGYEALDTYALTTSVGHYTIYGLPYYFDTSTLIRSPCAGGYSVSVIDSPYEVPISAGPGTDNPATVLPCYLDCQSSAMWPGQWNATVILGFPEILNFNLDSIFGAAWVPQAYAFSHTAFADIIYEKTVTYTTSSTAYLAGSGVTSSESNSVGLGSSTGWNGTAEWEEEYNVSGNVIVNMLGNRTPWVNMQQFWGHEIGEYSGSSLVSDWETPGNYTCQQMDVCNLWVQRGHAPTYANMTIGGSITHSRGFESSLSFGLTGPVGGAGVEIGPSFEFSFGEQSNATSSGSQQVELEFYIPSSATYGYYDFDAVFEGGTSSSVGLLADAWMVAESNSPP